MPKPFLDLSCSHLSVTLGPFDLLAERWAKRVPFGVSRPGVGEVIADVGRWRVMLTNHRRSDRSGRYA